MLTNLIILTNLIGNRDEENDQVPNEKWKTNYNCHVRNLSISDIIVKKTDLILKDEDGNEITRTEPRAKCYCENCDHGS